MDLASTPILFVPLATCWWRYLRLFAARLRRLIRRLRLMQIAGGSGAAMIAPTGTCGPHAILTTAPLDDPRAARVLGEPVVEPATPALAAAAELDHEAEIR